MIEELRIHIKDRDFHALSKLRQDNQAAEPGPRETLLDELEIQIEDLKNEAVRRFDKEEFEYCLQTFEFLSKLNPNDRSLRDYLDVCREVIGEGASAETDAQPRLGAEAATENSPILESNQNPLSPVAPDPHEPAPTELTRKMKACSDARLEPHCELVTMIDELRIHITDRDFRALSKLLQDNQAAEPGPREALLDELEI